MKTKKAYPTGDALMGTFQWTANSLPKNLSKIIQNLTNEEKIGEFIIAIIMVYVFLSFY